MSQAPAPTVAGSALSEVDRLFATLDGVRVSNELGEWSSRIQGIYADGPYVWVQLSHDDEETQSVVLRLPRQTRWSATSFVRWRPSASMRIHRPSSGFSSVAKVVAVLAAVGVAGVRALSADSSSAQLTVGVTVVRSCAVDSRAAGPASPVRLTCTAGARSNLRLSESIHTSSETVASDGLHVVTLNF